MHISQDNKKLTLEVSSGQYPNQNYLNVFDLNVTSGSKKYFRIDVETKYEKGQEFCLYDVACKLQNNQRGNRIEPKIGFQNILSDQIPKERIKTISMDEYGRDINRYKIKSENEIDLKETHTFTYGSIVQYQCDLGKSFEMTKNESDKILHKQNPTELSSDTNVVRNFNVTCEWDGNWSIQDFKVSKCVCE